MIGLQGLDRGSFPRATALLVSPLQQMIADVAVAAASPLERRHRRVASALLPYLDQQDLLRDIAVPCSPDRYVRHLLHAAEDHTILALVWRPGQMSPVHGHHSWCALGIHRGSMTETQFTLDVDRPAPSGSTQLHVGDISHAPPEPNAIHRLANLGTQTAISIHVYGARFDELGHAVNRIWAA